MLLCLVAHQCKICRICKLDYWDCTTAMCNHDWHYAITFPGLFTVTSVGSIVMHLFPRDWKVMQVWILHMFKIFVFFFKDIVNNELLLRRLHVFYRSLTSKISAKKGELGHLSSLRRKKTKLGKLHSHILVFPTHWQKFNIYHCKINKFCNMLFSFLC